VTRWGLQTSNLEQFGYVIFLFHLKCILKKIIVSMVEYNGIEAVRLPTKCDRFRS